MIEKQIYVTLVVWLPADSYHLIIIIKVWRRLFYATQCTEMHIFSVIVNFSMACLGFLSCFSLVLISD